MSRGFLLDTDVLSATARREPPPQVIAWLRVRESDVYTSSVAIAELSFGVHRLSAGRKKEHLLQWLTQLIEKMGDRILRFDTRTAFLWGQLQSDLERQARRMPLEDSYIAAIALRHNLIVATGNTADFACPALDIVNPFRPERPHHSLD